MSFRFILQPVMAAIAALHDGIKDARLGRRPISGRLSRSGERGGRLREGLIATARIILLGLGMDAIYQATVLEPSIRARWSIIAILLAVVPYFLLRGPFARVARWWSRTPTRRLKESLMRTTSPRNPSRTASRSSCRRGAPACRSSARA